MRNRAEILTLFWPSHILGGGPSKNGTCIITPPSPHVVWKSFVRELPSTSREVIGAHTLNFIRWRGASNESVFVKNGDFRFFRSLSSEHFTYMATRQLSRDTTVDVKYR